MSIGELAETEMKLYKRVSKETVRMLIDALLTQQKRADNLERDIKEYHSRLCSEDNCVLDGVNCSAARGRE